ncbi:T9SS type A sorting domain-containing protein [Hymenobacter sp. RP-2-7]|uniref:T9SS type A sorting domain-containing protein n=1 Tax=Hymenobacter polaris TaxID=2682546 RepID=A0A7Y0AET4_9BACT|nr:T9SS type A sorting domain-containing protein [Hymenobacter polaris]NML66009.1 T9SS type A sorting domain-containing protein [Hymenobacter polaris]
MSQLSAQVLDPAFHIPAVYQAAQISDAAQQPDGHYVVAGTFTQANGQASGGLARFDATGTLDATFQQNLRGVTVAARKVYPMANGQLLVLGSYQAGTTQRKYAFRLNADGTLDPTFELTFPGLYPYPVVAQAIVQPDGRILLLGYFTSSNVELCRLLADGSRDPSFSVTLLSGSQDTQMLLQPDGKVILGGDFTWLNGERGFFIARLTTDGSTDTNFHSAAYTNARLYITGLALDASGRLLVAGYAQNVVGGQNRAVFRLQPDGALDTSFTLDASLGTRNCQRLAVLPSGQIMALFDAYDSNNLSVAYPFAAQLVRLLPTGALDSSFQPGSGPDGLLTEVRTLPSGDVLTWGGIHNFAGQRRTVVLLQAGTGALATSFAPLLQQPGEISRLSSLPDGRLQVLGKFNSVDGHLTDEVARLLPTGQPDPTFAARQPASANTSATTWAVQRNGQVVLAGRGLTGSSGATQFSYLTRLTPTGALDASFTPAISLSGQNFISLLAEQASGQLVVGGLFTDAAGRPNLTRLTSSGSADPSFTPPAGQSPVYSGFAQPDGSLVCVTPLASSSYPGRQAVQRLSANGQPDPTFSYAPLPATFDVYLERVYPLPGAAGYATSGVFATGEVLGSLTSTGAAVPGFATPFRAIPGPAESSSGVRAVLAQPNGQLLVGGAMRQGSSYSSPGVALARLQANGQLDATFSTSFIPVASAASYRVNDLLALPDGSTLVGGYFLEAGGQPATGLVRLQAPAALATIGSQSSRAAVQIWPVPARESLHVLLAAEARPRLLTLLNALGQVVLTQPVTQPDFTLATAALPRGFYLLQVEYADGVAIRRIALE